MDRQSVRMVAALVVLMLGWSTRGQELQDPDAKPPPPGITVGSFSATMEERAPLSAIRTICGRLGWDFERVKLEKQEQDYEVTKESLEAYVPADYDGTQPYGLICFVSAGGSGRVHESWRPLLDKYKYIWVGANNDGNNRAVWCRIGVAIDATHHIMKRYKIDPERVYVSGGSGGGRTSSMMAIAFPDLYRGGIYIIGMNYYRQLPATNEPGKVWRATYARPNAELYKLTRERSIHIALEGDGDINRFQAKAVIDAYQKEGFKHTYYFEEPGVGHSMPSRDWIEKAFVALEEGRKKVAEGGVAGAKPVTPAAGPAKALAPAPAPVTTAAPASTTESEADKLVRMAKIYNQNRMYPQARERLQQVVKQYPGTPAAEEAKKLLAEMGKS